MSGINENLAYLVWFEDKTSIETMEIPYKDRYFLTTNREKALKKMQEWGFEDFLGMGVNLSPYIQSVSAVGLRWVYVMTLPIQEKEQTKFLTEEKTYEAQFQIHETDDDRKRQTAVLQFYVDHLNRGLESDKYSFVETKTLSLQDARIYQCGKCVGVVEGKWRNNPTTKFRDYTVDESKIKDLVARAKAESVPGVLVISWDGDVRFLNVTKAMDEWDGEDEIFPVSVQRNTQRDEYDDRVSHISYNFFTKIGVLQDPCTVNDVF